jgi:uncharacterized protein (TIGR03437 family)
MHHSRPAQLTLVSALQKDMRKFGWWKNTRACAVLLVCAGAAIASQAQTLTVLGTFKAAIGNHPVSALVRGTDGNFYGTVFNGGAFDDGYVFRVTPGVGLTDVYDFGSVKLDGIGPGGLIQATDGNFYGTASSGGANHSSGTVFKITPGGVETTVFSFGGAIGDGVSPNGGLIQATDGNFYGTTSDSILSETPAEETSGFGTIFKITPQGVLTTLYSFPTNSAQAFSAFGLLQGADGNFYGTASLGGTYAEGSLFEITPQGTFSTVYSFGGQSSGGAYPQAGLIQGTDGNFYGITSGSTSNTNFGTVFKITPAGVLTTLHTFCASGVCTDGNEPNPLIQGSDGNFYGTTAAGGANGSGTIFEITSSGTLTTLYSFCSQPKCADGSTPSGGLIQGTDGNFYGTTSSGTVFRFSTTSAAYSCATQPAITFIDSASGYGGYGYFTSGSWLEIKGTNLVNPADPRLMAATDPGQWTAADFNGVNAPTVLDNVSVTINGKPAYVWFLSVGQINVQAPEDSATGSVAITVNNCTTASSPFMFKRQALAPGFLAPSNYSANGTQYMVAFFTDGAYVLNTSLGALFSVNSRPAKPGDQIYTYGIGFGDVTPTILPGVIAGQSNTLVNPVKISFGTTAATIGYQGLTPGSVGLYQFNFTVPSGLANGDYQINVTQNGVAVPQTMYLTVQN